MSGPSRPAGDPALRAELVAAFVRQGKTEAEAAALASQVVAALAGIRVVAYGPGIDAPQPAKGETSRERRTRPPSA
jgi:hypothetical protein